MEAPDVTLGILIRWPATIRRVLGGAPADKAGLKISDLLREVDGRQITNSRDLIQALQSRRPGDRIAIVVERDGRRVTATVVLDVRRDHSRRKEALPANEAEWGPWHVARLREIGRLLWAEHLGPWDVAGRTGEGLFDVCKLADEALSVARDWNELRDIPDDTLIQATRKYGERLKGDRHPDCDDGRGALLWFLI